MASDLYWDWLNIPPEKRPPTLYDLLGLSTEVEDPEAINQAAVRQIHQVKQRLDVAHAAEGAKILQQLATAKAVLMDPARRAEYRAKLGLATTSGANATWWKDGLSAGASSVQPKNPADGLRPDAVRATQPSAMGTSTTPFSSPVRAAAPADFGQMQVDSSRPQYVRPNRRSSMGLVVLVVGVLIGTVGVGAAVAVIAFSTTTSQSTQQVVLQQPPTTAETTLTARTPTAPTTTSQSTPTEMADPVEPPEVIPTLSDAAMSEDELKKLAEPVDLKRHTGIVHGVAIAPNGRRIVSVGDSMLLDWNSLEGKSFRRRGFKVPPFAVAYSPDGKSIAVADEGEIHIVDHATNRKLHSLKHPRGQLTAFVMAADNKHLLAAGTDSALHWWDVSAEKILKSVEVSDGTVVASLALSPDGAKAVVGGADGTIGVWDVVAGKNIWRSKGHAASVVAVGISPNGATIVSAGLDKMIGIWSALDGMPIRKIAAHDPAPLCVAFLDGGRGFVTGGRDSTILVWNLESACPTKIVALPGPVHSLAVASGNRYVAVGCTNGNLHRLALGSLELAPIVMEKPPQPKLRKPEADEATEAVKTVHEQVGAQTTSPNETLIVETLLKKAASKVDPAVRFALFTEARTRLISRGDIAAALGVIDTEDMWFEIDDLAEKTSTIVALVPVVAEAGQKDLVEHSRKVLDAVKKDERNDLVKPLLDAMQAGATKSGSADLQKLVVAIQDKLAKESMTKDKLDEVLVKLKDNPNDQSLNLQAGVLRCQKNLWKEGLPNLVKGGSTALSRLAEMDLKSPKIATEQKAVGDGWWELAQKKDDAMFAWLNRAKYWYELCRPSLPADVKLDLATRLTQIDRTLKSAPGVAAGGGTTQTTGPKPKGPESVDRRNFNTIRTEAITKSYWKVEGESRVENGGLKLLANPQLTSLFQVNDNWRIEIPVVGYDGRSIDIEVHQETLSIRPMRVPALIIVERKGKKLAYVMSLPRMPATPSVISLADEKMAPSGITIKFGGNITESRANEGMFLASIIVSGKLKLQPAEPEKPESKATKE